MNGNNKRKEKRALAVVRVSSDEQARKGASLESQTKWVEKMGREMNLQVVKVIKEVVSGEVFPKKHFNEILEIVNKENITHLLVYALDRFARNLPYGTFLLQRLCEENSVILVTSTGVFDLNNRNHRWQVWFSLLMAEMEQGSRQERTFRGMVTKLQNGEWPLSPPFGYEKIDNQLRLMPEYKPVIHFIFDIFIQIKNYAETARIVNEKFGREMDFELTSNKIKKIVQDRTYLGFLRWNNILFGEGEENRPREALRVIDEETFSKAQAVAKRISHRYSRSNNGTIEKLIEEYGVENVIEVFDLKPACPKCNSHNTQKNGREEGNGTVCLKFICKDCGHQFRFPSKKQQKRIENLMSLPCRECGATESFELKKYESNFWELVCKNCGNKILLCEHSDSHHIERRSKIQNEKIESNEDNKAFADQQKLPILE